jgi:hypothetical protein
LQFPPRLATMLARDDMTGVESVFSNGSTKLATVMRALTRRYRWPIERQEFATNMVDGRAAWGSMYTLPTKRSRSLHTRAITALPSMRGAGVHAETRCGGEHVGRIAGRDQQLARHAANPRAGGSVWSALMISTRCARALAARYAARPAVPVPMTATSTLSFFIAMPFMPGVNSSGRFSVGRKSEASSAVLRWHPDGSSVALA